MRYSKHDAALVAPTAVIGEGTRVWAFVNVQDDVVIGENCNICDCCFIEKTVRIGNNVTVKNGVSIYEGVTLEDDVFVGPNAVFVNDRYPRSGRKDWKLEKTLVSKGASIGANATIMCGVTIGKYAVVGAGAVVTKNVAAHAVVLGNPAKQVAWVCQDGQRLNLELRSKTGKQYRWTEQGLAVVEGYARG